MNCEDFRDFCLSLPDATEKMPFQKFVAARSILAFYINGKIFCFYDIDRFDSCTIKCDPDAIEELKERYRAINQPYNLSRHYWISVGFNEDVEDVQIKELVTASYRIVKATTIQNKGHK